MRTIKDDKKIMETLNNDIPIIYYYTDNFIEVLLYALSISSYQSSTGKSIVDDMPKLYKEMMIGDEDGLNETSNIFQIFEKFYLHGYNFVPDMYTFNYMHYLLPIVNE